MNGWQVAGIIMLAIAAFALLSIAADRVNSRNRQQAMIDNENRRRMLVVHRYFDRGDDVRIFRSGDGYITSVHRQRDGEAVIFAEPEPYSGHVYTGTTRRDR